MFGPFKKKDPKVKTLGRYKALPAGSYRPSTIDRKASDLKRAGAEAVLPELDRFE